MPSTRESYDWICLASDEYGNEKMRQVAEEHFTAHPQEQFVRVDEHAGWALGFRRDGSIWTSANNRAVLDQPTPRPSGWSGRMIRRSPAQAA